MSFSITAGRTELNKDEKDQPELVLSHQKKRLILKFLPAAAAKLIVRISSRPTAGAVSALGFRPAGFEHRAQSAGKFPT